MVLGLVFAVSTAFNYASTPQVAAIQAVRYPGRAAAKVARADIVSNYATVLLRGAVVEAAPFTSAILLQRFSFGWQPLDVVDSRCVFASRGLDRSTEALLLRGMPSFDEKTSCKGDFTHDHGPPQQVEAVRKIARGPFVPFVGIYRDWAKSDWYGAGGGEHYYRLRNGVWQLAFGGGGAYSTEEVSRKGVPEGAWCALMIYDANCTK